MRVSCASADALLSEIAQRGAPVSSHTRRLLGLLDRYGSTTLEAAIATAMERGAYSAISIAHVCEQLSRARGEPPPIGVVSDDPRVSRLRIVPHDLGPYDDLGKKDSP